MSTDLGYKCTNFTTHEGALYECHGRSPNADSFIEVGDYLGEGFWIVEHPDYPTGKLWVCEVHMFEDLVGDLNL